MNLSSILLDSLKLSGHNEDQKIDQCYIPTLLVNVIHFSKRKNWWQIHNILKLERNFKDKQDKSLRES
jgi:hypothetical protein